MTQGERCPLCRRWSCNCAIDGSLIAGEHAPVEVDRQSTYPVYRCSCGAPTCKQYEALVKPEDQPASPHNSVDAMLARGVRAKHLAYVDRLMDALGTGVPERTLVEWGIPADDVRDAAQRLDLLTAPAQPLQNSAPVTVRESPASGSSVTPEEAT